MRWNAVRQPTILVDRSEGNRKVTENAGCFTSAEGLKRIDSSKRKASSTSPFTTSERNNSGAFPATKCLKLDCAVGDEEAKVTASPISKFMSLVRKQPDGGARGSMCHDLQGRSLLYTSPKLSGRGTVRSQKCAADREMKRHISGCRPVRKITSSKFLVENGGCKENLVGSAHRSGLLRAIPVHKDQMHLLTISHKDNIKLGATPEDEERSYAKVSPPLSKWTGQRMEEDRMTIIGEPTTGTTLLITLLTTCRPQYISQLTAGFLI